jgi:hypothetical protein
LIADSLNLALEFDDNLPFIYVAHAHAEPLAAVCLAKAIAYG